MFKAVEFDAAAKQRIAEAAKEELRLRLEGLLGIKTQVGPFMLYPLTVRGIVEMQFAENRLLSDKEDVEADDLLQFLFITSDEAEKRNQKRFFKRAGKRLRDKGVRREVAAYFHAQFNDMPTGGKSKGGDGISSEPFITGLIDTLANEYGWTFETIMKLPISSAFQLWQKIIFRLSAGKRQPSNPITQMARARELKRLQAEQAAREGAA